MNVETVEELCEYLADRLGIYAEERIEFVSDIEDRIRKAISNEQILNKLRQPTVSELVCEACSGSGQLLISDCDWCKGTGLKQTVR